MNDRLENKNFCILPWVSLQIRQDGTVFPCCRMSSLKPYGSMSNNSLSEIQNSDTVKNVQTKMLNNESVDFCTDCISTDKIGGRSLRQQSNFEFNTDVARTLNSAPENVHKSQLKYLDIRFSNVCNLKCRSCEPSLSTSWYNDAVALYGNQNFPKKTKLSSNITNLFQKIEERLDEVEKIYFAGGEPLLEEDHYLFLERLIALGKTNIILSYNSNLTVLKFKHWDVLQLWSHFKKIQLGASIDGIEKVAEYLRSGCDWTVVRNNLDKVRLLPNVNLNIYPTVGVLNAYHLTDLIMYMIKEKFILSPENFEINILQKPEPLSAGILNAEELDALEKHYQNFIQNLEPQVNSKLYLHIKSELTSFINEARSKKYSQFRLDFRKLNFKLDQIRNEKTIVHAPELFSLLYDEKN